MLSLSFDVRSKEDEGNFFIMDSQNLPVEDNFSMSRPEDDMDALPAPGADLMDISAPASAPAVEVEVDVTDREFGSARGDLLSDVINKASSFSQDPINHQDAGWNIADPAEDIPAVEKNSEPNSCRVMVPVRVDTEDEFLKDADVPAEAEEPCEIRIPPNQLASPSVSSFVPSRPHKRFRVEKPELSLRGATLIVEDENPLGARITCAVGRADGFSSVDLVEKNGEDGFLQHDFIATEANMPPMPLVPDPSPQELGEERFLAVRESSRSRVLRTIRNSPQLVFILFIRDSEGSLYLPSTSFFDIVVNKMEIYVMTSRPDLISFSWSADKWKSCGVLELAHEPELEEWRSALSKLDLNGFVADTFPQDSLLCGPDVSALLKDPYWAYDLSWFARSLTYRNKTLKGYVRTVASKVYEAYDYTRHGVCMDHWRLVYLTGDCVFMEHLAKFPSSFLFKAGPSTTMLRGGIRKPTFLIEPSRTQFTWVRCPVLPTEPVRALDPLALGQLAIESSPSPPPSSSSSSSLRMSGPVNVPSSAVEAESSKFPLVKSSSLPTDLSSSPLLKKPAAKRPAAPKNKAKPKYKSERLKASRSKRECC